MALFGTVKQTDDDSELDRRMSGHADWSCSVFMVGEPKSGTSSLSLRFNGESFDSTTFFTDHFQKTLKIGTKIVRVHLQDSIPVERYALRPFQCRMSMLRSHVIIIVFDLTNPISFEKASLWLDEALNLDRSDDANIVLLGNKCDLLLDRKVSREEAETFASKKNVQYFETSAKNLSLSTNIETLIKIQIAMIMKERPELLCRIKKEKNDKEEVTRGSGPCVMS